MTGNVSEVKRWLEKDPQLANQEAAQERHNYHIIRGEWQPVQKDLNPGVKNARGLF
jgi:hypothetical protein